METFDKNRKMRPYRRAFAGFSPKIRLRPRALNSTRTPETPPETPTIARIKKPARFRKKTAGGTRKKNARR
ncbi:MAG: hypothetical protein DBX55_05855 [Verrucomicrobia bacterium]|nr:MAG: hypothetical protein DBX55_05855 [Verrucomicrobiota bacterium]